MDLFQTSLKDADHHHSKYYNKKTVNARMSLLYDNKMGIRFV